MCVTVKFFKGHSFLKIHFYSQYFRPKRERRKESLCSVALKHLLYNVALCDVTKGSDGSLVALPRFGATPPVWCLSPSEHVEGPRKHPFFNLDVFYCGRL